MSFRTTKEWLAGVDAERDKLGAIIDLKHRFAYRMASLLRDLQWRHAECIDCGGHEHQGGHTLDCGLAGLLREWDESGDPRRLTGDAYEAQFPNAPRFSDGPKCTCPPSRTSETDGLHRLGCAMAGGGA